MFTSILLFAARHSRTASSQSSFVMTMVSFAAMVMILLIVCVADHVRKIKAEKRQRQIDQSHALYYDKWHKMVAMSGQIAPVACDLILGKGEECLWVEQQVTLYEVRAVRHSAHTFGSVPIGKGIRVGRGYSTSESSDEWRPIAEGVLYITNKKVYFDGDKQDRKIPISKISTIKADWSAVEISSETRQKSMVFFGVNGNVCREIVLCVSEQDD